jgi:alpha-tubulin suppressor-like RCC1 family protein
MYIIMNVIGAKKKTGAASLKTGVTPVKNGVKRFAEYIAGRTGSGNIDGFTYIDENNEVNVWGDGDNYSIGIDEDLSAPGTTIPLPPNAIGLASKVYRAQNLLGILTTNNEMYFMGYNLYGQFSNGESGTGATNNSVMKLCSVKNVKKICFGPYKIIATLYYVTNDGKLYAAGYNLYGVIGNGTNTNTLTSGAFLTQGPDSSAAWGGVGTRVKDAVLIGDDANATGLCLFEDGTVKTVGYGGRGQIGNGTLVNNNTWQDVTTNDVSLTNIVEIQGCGYDTYTTLFALDSANRLWGWGSGAYGVFGNGSTADVSSAIRIDTSSSDDIRITDFWACGGDHANALFVKQETTNKIYACGGNEIGQLGFTASVIVTALTEVTSVSGYNIKEIIMAGGTSTQYAHTYAVTENDQILVTGNNTQGQCSMGSITNLSDFSLCYTVMNNILSPIKLKSGISRNNPYIDLKHMSAGGNSWVLSNNNEVYLCGVGRWNTGTIPDEALYFLTRAKHWQ